MTWVDSSPRAAHRLVCFHAAGATAAMFADFRSHLPRHVIAETIELPGRGVSYERAPLRSMDEAIALVLPAMSRFGDRFSLFGYSMGALIAVELALRLHVAGGPCPAALIVAAARAPHLPAREPALHRHDDATLMGTLGRFEGTTPELLADRELMELVFPRIRTDFELCETYRFRHAAALSVPIHAFGGTADEHVSAADLAAWGALTDASFSCEQLPGGHFFLHDHAPALAAHVARLLGPIGQSTAAVTANDDD